MPANTESQAETPGINGVTTTERAARAANERDLSAGNASLMPSLGDLNSMLGVRTSAPRAATQETEEVEEPEDELNPEDTTTEEETAEDETTSEEESTEEETEETESTEEETAEQEEEEDEQAGAKHPVTAETITKMKKRIGVITAQHSETKAQLDAANARILELEEQGVPAAAATSQSPLAAVLTQQQLDAHIADAQAAKQWCIRNRDGGVIGTGDKARELTADEVANMLANAEAALDAAPARKEWISTRTTSEALLKQEVPEIFTPGTEQHKRVAAAVKELPPEFVAKFPDHRRLTAAMLIGLSILDNKLQQQGKPAAAAKPGAKPTTAAPAARPVKKAPPIPSGRTASKAPAAAVQKKAGDKLNTAIINGKPGALESRVLAFLG